MLRIGILSSNFAHERNIEHVLFRVSEILSEDYKVDIIGATKYSPRLSQQFDIHTELPATRFGILTALAKRVSLVRKFLLLFDYSRRHKPDLLLTLSGIGANGLCVAVTGRLLGIPAVNRITSDVFVVYKYKRPRASQLRLFLKNNVFGRAAIALANKTIILHEAQIPGLEQKGFNREKLLPVPQPIKFPPTASVSGQNDTDMLRLIPGDARIIGYIGRLDQDKNILLLAETMEILFSRDPSVWFLVIGQGGSKPWLQDRLKNTQTLFIEQLPRDLLAPYYERCEAIIQTSFSEGLSSVIAEALYFGTPVISTDSGPVTRALVSNIGKTPEELANIIAHRNWSIDSLPDYMLPDDNKALWKKTIKTALEQD